MSKGCFALTLALVVAACGGVTHARFTGSALPVGDFTLSADRCSMSNQNADGGTITSVEFSSESRPGLVAYVRSQTAAASTSILSTPPRLQGEVGVIRVGANRAQPSVVIPSSQCETFQLAVGRSWIPDSSISWDDVTLDLDCRSPNGGRLQGHVRWHNYCQ